MNDVGELKEYAGVHARGQRLDGYPGLLERIRTDEGRAPGSWTGEWLRAGELLEAQGDDLGACRHYAMARFPYVDGPARQEAQERCVAALDRWRSGRDDVQPLDVELDGGRVRCWTTGLSPTRRLPLLVVMGGIVTVKEQWAPTLPNLGMLGVAGLVAEMPSVGENTLPYGPESWRMLSALLDAVADRADVTRTHAIALSFSGHMALQCALRDDRVKGIITVGAPVGEFFTDAAWQRRLPRITIDTLAHMTGIPAGKVPGGLGDRALSGKRLAALDIPVCYTASLRDEIIPPGDVRLLKDHVRRLDLLEHDDVHGAPGHVEETQAWTVSRLRSLLCS